MVEAGLRTGISISAQSSVAFPLTIKKGKGFLALRQIKPIEAGGSDGKDFVKICLFCKAGCQVLFYSSGFSFFLHCLQYPLRDLK